MRVAVASLLTIIAAILVVLMIVDPHAVLDTAHHWMCVHRFGILQLRVQNGCAQQLTNGRMHATLRIECAQRTDALQLSRILQMIRVQSNESFKKRQVDVRRAVTRIHRERIFDRLGAQLLVIANHDELLRAGRE